MATLDDKNYREIDSLPGSYGIPFFGTVFHSIFNPRKYVSDNLVAALSQGFKMFRARPFGYKSIVVSDPEIVKWLLQKENKYVSARWFPHLLDMFGRDSLFVVTHERHTLFRRLLGKAFQPAAMDKALPLVKSTVQGFLKSSAEKGVTDLLGDVKALTFTLAIKLFVGPGRLSDDEIIAMRNKYDLYLGAFGALPIRIAGSSYNKGLQTRNELAEQLAAMVEQIKEEDELGVIEDDRSFGSIVKILVSGFNYDQGESMNTKQIVDNLLILLFAGGDTGSSVMTLLIIVLHNRRDIVAKLLKEQDDFIKEKGSEEYTREDLLNNMPYISAVLQELLKVLPIVGGIMRKAIDDFVLPGTDVVVRKGTGITLSYLGAHYSDQPENITADLKRKIDEFFDPDSAVKAMADGTYDHKLNFGFGGGARACLGRPLAEIELRVYLVELVRHYEFSLPEDNQYPELRKRVFPTPVKPLAVNFTKK